MENKINQTKNSSHSSSQANQLKREQLSVHSMPHKFVEVTQKTGRLSKGNSGGKGKKLLLLAIVLVFVIVLVIGGVWFYLDTNRDDLTNTQVNNTQQNRNNNQNNNNNNQNTNQVTDNTNDENTNDDSNQNDDNIFDINDNQNTNDNVNDNNVNDDNSDINDNQLALDLDNDGLSFEEETTYGTDPEVDDTDRDGYKDGQEITSLYNPLSPGEDLFISGLVKRFISANEGYSFLRPRFWTARISGDSSRNIVVLPDSESGESFTIEVMDNEEGRTLSQALSDMSDILGSADNYQNYSLSGVSALRSLDAKTVVAINNGLVFVLSHETSPFGDVVFRNTFEMMLNSFEWTES